MNEPKRTTGEILKWLALAAAVAFVFMLIMPATPQRRGGRPVCISNLRNVAVAVQNYASINDNIFPAQSSGPSHISWRVAILPLIDQADLYRRYHRNKSWDDPANLDFAKTKIPVYVCPTNPSPHDSLGRYYTAFSLLTGPGTAYDQDTPRKLDDLFNGLSQTVLLAETCGASIVWNEPRDVNVERNQIDIQLNQDMIKTSGG